MNNHRERATATATGAVENKTSCSVPNADLVAIANQLGTRLEPLKDWDTSSTGFVGRVAQATVSGVVLDSETVNIAIECLTPDQASRIIELLNRASQLQPSPTRSCFNCRYCKSWSFAGTLEDPPDSGWDCQHPEQATFGSVDPDAEEACTTDSETAVLYAADCPGYDYQPPVDETEPDFEPLTVSQQAELEQVAIEAETQRLINSGFLTPDGKPTDSFYQAADTEYDSRRRA